MLDQYFKSLYSAPFKSHWENHPFSSDNIIAVRTKSCLVYCHMNPNSFVLKEYAPAQPNALVINIEQI